MRSWLGRRARVVGLITVKNKKGIMRKLKLMAGAACVAVAISANAVLVLDGGFEVGSPGNYKTIFTGGTIGAWTVSAGSVDLIGTYWQHSEGTRSVDWGAMGTETFGRPSSALCPMLGTT